VNAGGAAQASMSDILTLARRSALMAKVRGTGDASTELRLLAVVRALGVTGLAKGGDAARRRSQVERSQFEGREAWVSGPAGFCVSGAEARGVCRRVFGPA
jgi:hypothetical protein